MGLGSWRTTRRILASRVLGESTLPAGPEGIAPFGVPLLAGKLQVTYARQDAAGEDASAQAPR